MNNAGINFDMWQQASGADLAQVHETLETNLFGPWRMCQAFLPLLRASAPSHIVNVSSQAGSFDATPGVPFTLIGMGGTVPGYGVSKAALNALTVKLAADLHESDVRINAVCPGFTATHPGTAEMGARPVEAGAASVVWAALLPPDGPTGGFFRDGQPLAW